MFTQYRLRTAASAELTAIARALHQQIAFIFRMTQSSLFYCVQCWSLQLFVICWPESKILVKAINRVDFFFFFVAKLSVHSSFNLTMSVDATANFQRRRLWTFTRRACNHRQTGFSHFFSQFNITQICKHYGAMMVLVFVWGRRWKAKIKISFFLCFRWEWKFFHSRKVFLLADKLIVFFLEDFLVMKML